MKHKFFAAFCTALLLLAAFLLAACGRVTEESTASQASTEGETPSASLQEEDCEKPVGCWRGYLQNGLRPVVRVHDDLRVTLFKHDTSSLSAEPLGETFEGSWYLADLSKDEAELAAVLGANNEEVWKHWKEQIAYIWRFTASGAAEKASGCPALYFIRGKDDGWSMVNPEEKDAVEGYIVLTEDRTYDKVKEEDCPKPQGAYKANVLIDGKWTEMVYLDVKEDGSVILYYSDGKAGSGTEMAGRWTLWKNLEQEGTFGTSVEGDSWQKWNRETAYVWRFDSSETYPFGEDFREPVWMLFSFKTDGSLWLHHQWPRFDQVSQLKPADTALIKEWQGYFDEGGALFSHFLMHGFAAPEEIDLAELMAGGPDGRGVSYQPTDEERAFWNAHPEHTELAYDPVRWTSAELDAVLEKYLGLKTADTSKNGLDKLLYWDKTDAYYCGSGGVTFRYQVVSAEQESPDRISVGWSCKTAPGEMKGTAVFRLDGENRYLVSNTINE